MNDLSPSLLGSWLRRFLLEYLVGECNLAHNTQLSYRDAMVLLLPFMSKILHKDVDQLTVSDLTADLLRKFLTDLETTRHSSIATRNQRLAAIHALARFIAQYSPEYIAWSTQIRSVPFKRTSHPMIGYLDKPEMDALLDAPDRRSAQGHRDYILLLFLYNSGARASEVAQLRIQNINIASCSVKITGKGGKQRNCPLWPQTVKEITALIDKRSPNEPVFLNRCGIAMTRFGIHNLVKRYALKLKSQLPSMENKRVSPHTIRHSTACHLLRAGVDINTIRGWLGHVSLDTTNIYAEIDLEAKREALTNCEINMGDQVHGRWHQPELMAFLHAL